MVLGIKETEVKEIERPETPLGIKTTPMVSVKGSVVPKEYYTSLSKAEKAIFSKGGIPALEEFHKTHLKDEEGKFIKAVDYIKVLNGYITKKEFNKLSLQEQEIVKSKGMEGLYGFYQAHLVSDTGKFVPKTDYEEISGGYYPKAEYDVLSIKEKDILEEKGASALDTFYATHLKDESGVFVPKANFIEIIDGYFPKSEYNALSSVEQDILKAEGTTGLNKFYDSHVRVTESIPAIEAEKLPSSAISTVEVFKPKSDYVFFDREVITDLPGADKIPGLEETSIETTYIPKSEWGKLSTDEQKEYRDTGKIAPRVVVGDDTILKSKWDKMTIGQQLTEMLGRRPTPSEYLVYGKQIGVFKDVWTVSPGYGTKGASGYWTKAKTYAGRGYRSEYGVGTLAWEDLRTVGEFIVPVVRATRADVGIKDISVLEWISTATLALPAVGYGLKAVGITVRAIAGALGTTATKLFTVAAKIPGVSRLATTGLKVSGVPQLARVGIKVPVLSKLAGIPTVLPVARIGVKVPIISPIAGGTAYVARNPWTISPSYQVPRFAFKVLGKSAVTLGKVFRAPRGIYIPKGPPLTAMFRGSPNLMTVQRTAIKHLTWWDKVKGIFVKTKIVRTRPPSPAAGSPWLGPILPEISSIRDVGSTPGIKIVRMSPKTSWIVEAAKPKGAYDISIVKYPELGPVSKQIMDIMGVGPGTTTPIRTVVGTAIPAIAAEPSVPIMLLRRTIINPFAPSQIGVNPLTAIGISPAIMAAAYTEPVGVPTIQPITIEQAIAQALRFPGVQGVSAATVQAIAQAQAQTLAQAQSLIQKEGLLEPQPQLQPQPQPKAVRQAVKTSIKTDIKRVRGFFIDGDEEEEEEEIKEKEKDERKVAREQLETIFGTRPAILARLPILGRWIVPERLRSLYSKKRVVEKKKRYRRLARPKILGSKDEGGTSNISKTSKSITIR